MKINKKIITIVLLCVACFSVPSLLFGMRRGPSGRRPLQAAPNLAAFQRLHAQQQALARRGSNVQPAPVSKQAVTKPQDNDEGYQRALALSLEVLPKEVIMKASPSVDVNTLPESLVRHNDKISAAVNALSKVLPDEKICELIDLQENAQEITNRLEFLLLNFYEAKEIQDDIECADLIKTMDVLVGRLKTIEQAIKNFGDYVALMRYSDASDFPVPASIQRPGLVVRHLRTGGQQGATCGHHAAINACAVQRIVANHDQQLTTENVQAVAKTLHDRIKGQDLYDYQVYALAQAIKLERFLIFGFNSGISEFYDTSRSVEYIHDSDLQAIFTLIKTSAAGAYAFILNTGGHWVSVVLVKAVGQMPQLIYQDSGNGKLDDKSRAVQFIQYLQAHLL